MYLLLGSPQDPCCLSVGAALKARGCQARIVANPLTHPWRFAWRFTSWHAASQLVGDDGQLLTDTEIAGVLVRSAGWVEPNDWKPDDLAYMQAETQAALLAWLWSLACPVINRYPAAVWYRPQTPLLFWQPLLWQCGLSAVEALVSNMAQEAHAFGEYLGAGAVYAPLTAEARYQVASDEDWERLAAMQRCAPVCLTHTHGVPSLACVVGQHVVWEGSPPTGAPTLEPALRRFAAAAGLAFVAVVFAPTIAGLRVAAIEPYPHFERFGQAAQQEIVAELVGLLMAALDGPHGGVPLPR
jgi:hypothetical protein